MVTGWSSLPPRNAYRYAGEESDAAFPGGAILPRLGPPELTRPAAFNSTVEQFSSTQSVSGSVTYCERCDFRYGCAPCKGGAFQWVKIPPGNRSSRKQSEQSWR